MTAVRPLRILLLNFEKGWRGGERQTLLCLQQFREQKQDVALLARHGQPLAQIARAQGFTVFEASHPAGLCRMLWHQRRRFEIFHAQTANTLTWLALLKPFLAGRVVFTRRTAFAARRRQAVTAWKWRQVDAFIAISRAAAAEPQRLGVDVTAIIPSAVQPAQAQAGAAAALRQQYVAQGRRVLATAAALTPEKDPLTLIRAVHRLREQRQDFVFLHFGADGSVGDAARRAVAELGLTDWYRFVGFHEDMAACYEVMDGFVLASREEALGTSALDAFLYRVPVVGTRAGGLAEVLAEDRALVCPVGDSACLADAMARVLDQPVPRQRRVDAAYRYVQDHHSVATMAGRTLKVYRAVLDGA